MPSMDVKLVAIASSQNEDSKDIITSFASETMLQPQFSSKITAGGIEKGKKDIIAQVVEAKITAQSAIKSTLEPLDLNTHSPDLSVKEEVASEDERQSDKELSTKNLTREASKEMIREASKEKI